MELLRTAKKVGNSAGVLLPRKLLGAEVKIIVLSRQTNLKKIALKRLFNHLSEVLGVYIISKSPAEILAVSSNVRKVIEENDIKLTILPLKTLKIMLKTDSLLRDKLFSSEVILNKLLLASLKEESYNRVITLEIRFIY